MKIYLDVSCLNRPFDDQAQVRIRLEAEAVLLILERFDDGAWEQVSSDMAAIETGGVIQYKCILASRLDIICISYVNIMFTRASTKSHKVQCCPM